MDMTDKLFEQQAFGKAALMQIGEVPENFRLYASEWVAKNPTGWLMMKVTGAEFRHAKSGKNKGLLTIMVKSTKRTVYVTRDEMNTHKAS